MRWHIDRTIVMDRWL